MAGVQKEGSRGGRAHRDVPRGRRVHAALPAAAGAQPDVLRRAAARALGRRAGHVDVAHAAGRMGSHGVPWGHSGSHWVTRGSHVGWSRAPAADDDARAAQVPPRHPPLPRQDAM
eukprot:141301-Prymnesium_polylepis.1